MADITEFNAAFNIFVQSGLFKISHVKLSLRQLQMIKDHILKNAGAKSPATAYEIHLNNIELIPFHIEEFIEPTSAEKYIVTGPPSEEELPASLKSQSSFLHTEDKTLRLLDHMERSRGFRKTAYFRKISYEYPTEKVESTLLNLFKLANWKTICLESISVLGQKDENYLTYKVISKLYNKLSPHAINLKELSLKKVDLLSADNLVIFLKKASNLEILRLEDIQPFSTNSQFLKTLCEGLVEHPNLKQLDLSNVIFKQEDYLELFELLNTNYHLDRIILNSPSSNGNLNELHTALTQQIEDRVRKTSLVRFKEKQLTVDNVYKLAELSLEFDNCFPIKLSLHPETKELLITHPDNLGLSSHLIEKLPAGLRKYPEYLQKSLPIQLDISQPLYDQTTIGALLLEKSFELRKLEGMELLLSAGADLLERLPNKSSLVKRIFSESKEGELKQIMVNYVKNDLNFFAPFWRIYNSNLEIGNKLEAIKLELDKFLTKLLEVDQLPLPLKIFRGIGLDTKKENWEKDFRLIIQAIRVGSKDYPIKDVALDEFEKVINFLLSETEEAKKNWFGGYKFNHSLYEEINQLLNLVQEYKQKVKSSASSEEATNELREQLSKSQELIKKLLQEKMDTEAKHAQDKAELKAELWGEIQIEIEANRQQDKQEMEVKREQDKAEMNIKINELIKQFQVNQVSSNASNAADEKQESSPAIFFRS